MSVFTQGDDNQNTGETEDQGNTSFVETLVKLKGDKWSDPEIIAKGKIDADNYVKELEAKVAELSKKANQGEKIDELLAKIGEKAVSTATTNPQLNNSGAAQTDTKTSVSEEEIQSLVEKTLTEREREQTVAQNLKQVNDKLESLFGTEAAAKVKEKSKALGISLERMQEIAAESPGAFFALVGEKQEDTRPSIKGSIRTESVNMQNTGVRNNAFYQGLRKSNPRQFYNAQTQSAMMADRAKLGEKFYN